MLQEKHALNAITKVQSAIRLKVLFSACNSQSSCEGNLYPPLFQNKKKPITAKMLTKEVNWFITLIANNGPSCNWKCYSCSTQHS